MHPINIAVIGLGYVGLPLALRLSSRFSVLGFDVDGKRIEELRSGYDRTGECSREDLDSAAYRLSADEGVLIDANVFIVTVPTPVDESNAPDLGAVLLASACVGRALRTGDIVVFESTVYPGVTEDICGPAMERESGLKCGKDFFLGYSPERINPGDREHTVDRIAKVVAGQTQEVTDTIAGIYGAVTRGGVFRAADIRTAEAAKVIENAQRDINIAFINEVAMIFSRMGINTHDVLEAANTKWNFLDFKPGLVGGHCIGVDPFYLAHAARQAGHEPEVILAGRRINDGFAEFAANRIHQEMTAEKGSRILVLGLTFKENVPDLRNSKVANLISALAGKGHWVDVHDPLADAEEALREYGLHLHERMGGKGLYDCIVGAVPHDDFKKLGPSDFSDMLATGGLIADLKGIWRGRTFGESFRRWEI